MNRTQRVRRFRLATLALSLGAVLAVSSLPAAMPARAAGNATVRIDPATVSAPGPGSSFTVAVTSNADVAAAGIQASLTFDRSILQITGFNRPAAAWGSAEIFVGPTGDLTSASNRAAAIAAANGSGRLATVAATYTPPSKAPAAVDQPFLLVTFQVIGCPAGGTTAIGLPTGSADTAMIDEAGDPVAITTAGATVTPCANNTGNTRTRVTSSLGAGVLAIEVPAAVTIPLIRQVTNSVGVPVTVYSDGIWSLKVEDAMPAGKAPADRGHMTDGIPATKKLANPMSAQADEGPVRVLSADPVGDLLSGAGTISPVVTLRQFVGPSDPPGSYGISLNFTATSGF